MDNLRTQIVNQFPPLSSATLELLRTLEQELSLKEVGDLISRDPTMAGEIIRVANSPLFRRAREVTDAHQASVVLGSAVVRRLAMRLGLERSLCVPEVDALFPQVWQHSVATGEIAKALGGGLGLAPNLAYTAGLLHDLGVLGLAAAHPQKYALVPDAARAEDFDLASWERNQFGVDNHRVRSWIAVGWGLPSGLSRALIHRSGDPADDSIQNIVTASAGIAASFGFALFGRERRNEEQILSDHRLGDLVHELPETFELETAVTA